MKARFFLALLFVAAIIGYQVPARADVAGGTVVTVNLPITAPGILAQGTLGGGFQGASFSVQIQAGPGTHVLLLVEWSADGVTWNQITGCGLDGDYIHVPFSFPVVYQMPLVEATSGCSGSAGPSLAGMKVRLNAAEVTGTNLLTTFGIQG